MSFTFYPKTENGMIKGWKRVEFDGELPCVSCGEPVLTPSMGGTRVCPSCDLGKCRYCSRRVDEMSGLEQVLSHMKNHREKQSELVEKTNSGIRAFQAKWERTEGTSANYPEKVIPIPNSLKVFFG